MASRPPPRPPGPDHPITVRPASGRVIVRLNGTVIAESDRALTLEEAGYPPVHYIPREDARTDLMTRTDHTTFCPFKGDAAYYSVTVGGRTADNLVWTYEDPPDTLPEIKDRLAFDASRVDSVAVS